ncbi:MAG TPA: restriction endonuclease [Opitutaceae bacterium]|nr:restriction endonuclease [Opitutaceae bacterium]
MLRWWIIALSLVIGAANALGLSISPGDSRARVLETYGHPKSQAKAGEREILYYEEGSVVFRHGKVVELRFNRAEPRLMHAPTPKPAVAQKEPGRIAPSPTRSPQRIVPLTEQLFPVQTRPTFDMRSGFKVWLYVIPSMLLLFCGIVVFGGRGKRRRRSWDSRLVEDPVKSTSKFDQKPAHAVLKEEAVAVPVTGLVGTELTPGLLARLEWRRFEELVHAYFETQQWKPQRSNVGADGGIDIFLYRSGEGRPGAIVQCKAHHKPIDVKWVREFYGVMASEKVADGYFVSRSGYTVPARDFAAGKTLLLWSGDDLVEKFAALGEEWRSRIMTHVFRDDLETPTCPSCDRKMVRRTRKDTSIFWGCRNFPRCQTIMYPREDDGAKTET